LVRYVTEPDDQHRANVTMIGNDIAKRFFGGVDPLGKSIYIDGESYLVVGVAKEVAAPLASRKTILFMSPSRRGAKYMAATSA